MTHPLFKWRALEKHPLAQTERYFFATEPFTSFKNLVREQKVRAKPFGLWYACGPEWLDWVEGEMPQWADDWTHLYKLTLGRNVLQLTEPEELDRFTREYAMSSEEGPRYRGAETYRVYYIDWPRVAETYNGIEICPYQWSRRMSLSWYNGWDVASGCLWHSAGLGRVELVSAKEWSWQLEAV